MECIEARPLIPSYLDGELSEAQARPLRKHLLDCPECRSGAQGEKNLKRWFVQEEPVAPNGALGLQAQRPALAWLVSGPRSVPLVEGTHVAGRDPSAGILVESAQASWHHARFIVAADSVGAGAGEEVFFVRGKEASFPFYPTEVPADAGIVGIVDHWHLG